MSDYVQPALFALFLWWFSTGVILYLDRLPQHTFKWSLAGAAIIVAAALWFLYQSRTDTTVQGAYIAFTSGLMIWAWQEISFYTGYVTGPRKTMCATGCSGWRHFGHALQANLYHEISILIGAAFCVALTWGAPNQTGLWTYVLLWWMHESARLNVFLGVRNLNEQFLPEHMAFLRSFLTRKPINLLFPFSVTISTAMTMWLVQQALAAPSDGASASFSFLAALLALAVLEHWFLVLPLPAEKLWGWSLPANAEAENETAESSGGIIVPLSRPAETAKREPVPSMKKRLGL